MIAGRYSLDREVGRGGMGAVWLATDKVLGRQVALKRLGMMPGSDAPVVARAEREARLAARLNHPHVVGVYDLAADGDETWLVMEYVDGESLADRLRREGAMPAAQAVPIVEQCADALQSAHAAGIVHRDVKPSNIMVGRDGRAKITDFGIARGTADPSLTQTGLVTGSPAYLAPEVAMGGSATPASDVWSLGATLYHALSGAPPYDVGDNVMGGLYRIVHEEPPRLEGTGDLAPLLAGTMSKDPEQRWSMQQVRDHLRRVAAGGQPTQAMAPVPVPVAAAPPAQEHQTASTEVVPPAAPAPSGRTGATAAEREGTGSRRRWMLAPVLLLALLLVGIWAVTSGGDEGDETANDPSSPTETQAPTSESPSSKSPSSKSPSETTSSESPSPSAAETRAQMEQFITDYVATAPQDSRTTYQQLTPGFQAASGNYQGYNGFWSTIESAELQSVTADPQSLVVTYSIRYVKRDGSQMDDKVELQLVRSGDGFLIGSEA